MRYLLDTSTLLWFLSEDRALRRSIRGRIEDRSNNVFLSLVSLWELAIKINIGKLDSSLSLSGFTHRAFEVEGFIPMHIKLSHIERYATLPLHHRDPFDRLLIAQSIVEDIPMLTSDRMFDRYPMKRIW